MAAIDGINRRFGRGTIGYGTAGEQQGWSLRREFISARYTTVLIPTKPPLVSEMIAPPDSGMMSPPEKGSRWLIVLWVYRD